MDSSPRTISFFVDGRPQPAGSKRALPVPNGRGGFAHAASGVPLFNVIDDNPRSAEWKRAVAATARLEFQDTLLTGPIRLTVMFHLRRPACHLGTGRNADKVKPSAPRQHLTKPDALKLARAVEDALTGVIWRDDAQIVEEVLSKQYGAVEGVQVTIEEI